MIHLYQTFLWICLFFIVSLYLMSVLYFFLFSFLNIKKKPLHSHEKYIIRRFQRHPQSLYEAYILLIYAVISKSTKSQFIKCSLKTYISSHLYG